MRTLYEQMRTAAEPVLKNFHTDLSVHDARGLERTTAGQNGIWIVRDSGTHFIPRPDVTDPAAIRTIAMIQSYLVHLHALHPAARWHTFSVVSDGGYGHLSACPAIHALQLVSSWLDQASRHCPVTEISTYG